MRRFSKLDSESVFALSGKKRDRAGLSRSRMRSKTVESLESRQMLAADLVISEFLSQNTTGPFDGYGVRSDWIEIRNVTGEAINLAGWHLTDDNDNLSMWTFPSQSIAAGAYLIVWASQQDDAVVGQPLHTNFKLNTDGEYLALVRPNLSIASEFAPEYPTQSSNISYGRSTSLTTEGYFATPTFGTANTVDPVPDPAQQIFISEIMYHPAHEQAPGNGVWIDDPVTNEWIEIHNRGTQTVNLQNWQIDAGVTFTFPNVSITGGQNLVIAANVAAFNAKYPGVTNVVGGWTGQLSNRTENVRIIDRRRRICGQRRLGSPCTRPERFRLFWLGMASYARRPGQVARAPQSRTEQQPRPELGLQYSGGRNPWGAKLDQLDEHCSDDHRRRAGPADSAFESASDDQRATNQ
jgi:hypothetical protein